MQIHATPIRFYLYETIWETSSFPFWQLIKHYFSFFFFFSYIKLQENDMDKVQVVKIPLQTTLHVPLRERSAGDKSWFEDKSIFQPRSWFDKIFSLLHFFFLQFLQFSAVLILFPKVWSLFLKKVWASLKFNKTTCLLLNTKWPIPCFPKSTFHSFYGRLVQQVISY